MGQAASASIGRDYQPTARRPIAAPFRATADAAVCFCLRARIRPDAISLSSIGVSALAAIAFWRAASAPWLLLAAPALCYLRLWLNMLDGMVAIASRQASPRGEILNDFPDRISDVLIFAGVAHSGLASPFPAYWAAILALLTAYVGMLGQAVGARREFSGVMSKPWRIVVLHTGAMASLAAIWTGRPISIAGLTPFDWACLLVVIGCVQTIAVRLRRTVALLETSSESLAHSKTQGLLR